LFGVSVSVSRLHSSQAGGIEKAHNNCGESKHLHFRDEMKYPEEDRTAEKDLDLPARSPALRDEGRAEPLRNLTINLEKLMKTSILALMNVTPKDMN
jgi:hypothetical protein